MTDLGANKLRTNEKTVTISRRQGTGWGRAAPYDEEYFLLG